MFEDSLIESGGKLKTKRGWTSIVSFAIQMCIIGVMVLIPLIFTEALPKGTTLFMLVAPPPPPPPPPPAAAVVQHVKQVQTDIVNGERFVLQLVPCGILRDGCRAVIGNGVVLDPFALLKEVEALRAAGITVDGNLFISNRAQVILPDPS